MRFIRTNTAVRLTVGPFFDKTDGVTPEVAITVTSCKLTLMVDDGNVPTLVLDTAPTASGGANDMVHVTGDDAGFYDLELAAGNVNYLGRAMLAITDAAVHCPVFHEFMILPAMIYDSLVLGTDVLQADVAQWLGTNASTPTVAGVPNVNAKTWNDLATVELPLVPTTAGRKLDVSAGGEAGVDWANVGGPTTALDLSGTTIKPFVAGSFGAASLNGKGDWNIGKTGYALSAAGVQAIWDALTSALTTAGSIGKLLVDNVDAAISSRLATSGYTAPLSAAGVRTAVGLATANLDTQLGAIDDFVDGVESTLADATFGLAALETLVDELESRLTGARAGYLDNLSAGAAALQTSVDDLEGRVTAALATQLQAHSLGVGRGVVDAASTTTAVKFKTVNGNAPSGTDDFYNGRHIVFTSGALLLQACSISDYVGATKVATVPALTSAPAEDVTFVIV